MSAVAEQVEVEEPVFDSKAFMEARNKGVPAVVTEPEKPTPGKPKPDCAKPPKPQPGSASPSVEGIEAYSRKKTKIVSIARHKRWPISGLSMMILGRQDLESAVEPCCSLFHAHIFPQYVLLSVLIFRSE